MQREENKKITNRTPQYFVFKKNPLIVKLVGKVLREAGYLHSFKISLHNIQKLRREKQ